MLFQPISWKLRGYHENDFDHENEMLDQKVFQPIIVTPQKNFLRQ